jgi:exodeoxyribonuclease VII small subunit
MTKTASPTPNLSALSFEEALAELEKIVQNLETGKIRLDEAVAAYERGAALKKHCEAKLREAELKVQKITIAEDGSLGLEKN